MDRPTFLKLADSCLERVASWLEDFDPDEVDFSTPDGVVAIEFPDRTKYILNRQAATDQMWFAAGARAWHYDRDDAADTWRCDKDGHDLYERIGKALSEKLGRSISVG